MMKFTIIQLDTYNVTGNAKERDKEKRFSCKCTLSFPCREGKDWSRLIKILATYLLFVAKEESVKHRNRS